MRSNCTLTKKPQTKPKKNQKQKPPQQKTTTKEKQQQTTHKKPTKPKHKPIPPLPPTYTQAKRATLKLPM